MINKSKIKNQKSKMRLKLNRILIFLSVVVLIAGIVLFSSLEKQIEKDRVLAIKDEATENDPVAKLRCPNCNVILIGVDTLRADHLSSYGYFRDTSPNIDKFAEKGVLFKNTFSASSKTTPSFMSMFTSLYPTDHGILIDVASSRVDIVYTRINESIKTLAQVLKENGYKTQGLINTHEIPPEFGFDRGFDSYEYSELSFNREKLLNYLRKNKDNKFFVFFHDNGPHDPYQPIEPYYSIYDVDYYGSLTKDKVSQGYKYYKDFVDKENQKDLYHLEALYDGEIKWLDEFIGRLQDVLLETNLVSNTIVVFTSDHGEQFLEHGGFGHNRVYNEILKVPLIINSPRMKKNIEIDESVRTVDIMPTIMDIVGITSGISLRGRSLLPFIKDPPVDMDLPIIAMRYNVDDSKQYPSPLYYTIKKGDFKYIRNFKIGKDQELYDLNSDPKELLNLWREKKDKANELFNYLQQIINDSQYIYKPSLLNLFMDDNKKDNLRSLGY